MSFFSLLGHERYGVGAVSRKYVLGTAFLSVAMTLSIAGVTWAQQREPVDHPTGTRDGLLREGYQPEKMEPRDHMEPRDEVRDRKPEHPEEREKFRPQEGRRPMMGEPPQEGEGDEQQIEREEEERARQEEVQRRQLERMKQGMKSMEGMLKRVENRMIQLEKQGIRPSDELKLLVQSLRETLAKIMAAESMEDEGVQEAMESLQDQTQELQEQMHTMEQMARFPMMFKQITAELKKVDSAYTRTEKSAKRSKVNVDEALQAFRQDIDKVKGSFEEAKQALKAGDPERAGEILESEVMEPLRDLYQHEALIRALLNMKAQVTQFDRFLDKAKKVIQRQEKTGKVNEDLKTAIQEMVNSLDVLKAALKQRLQDPEELRGLVDDVLDAQEEVRAQMEPPRAPSGSSSGTREGAGFDFQGFMNWFSAG